jgi:hypothetical protein
MCGPRQYTTCHMADNPDKRKNKPGGNPQQKKGTKGGRFGTRGGRKK